MYICNIYDRPWVGALLVAWFPPCGGRLGGAVSRPHFFTVAVAYPAAAAAATVSNTRLLPGGDHLMTTALSSIAIKP